MKRILYDKDGSGGGGNYGPQNDNATAYAMARRHNSMDLYESFVNEGWSLDKFRQAVLERVRTDLPSSQRDPGPNYIQTRSQGGAPWNIPNHDRGLSDEVLNDPKFQSFLTGKGQRGWAKNLDWHPFKLAQRATVLTSTGPFTGYERPPGVVILNQQPATIGNLFSFGQTSQPTVRLIKETSFTNAAAAVAEEGQKPEATFDLEEVDVGVKKIAVVARSSDELVDDFPDVRQYLIDRLRDMVVYKVDSELLNGDGTSNRPTGVLSTSGIQTQGNTDPTIADTLARALMKVWTGSFETPDAIVMHPNDFMSLRLLRGSDGRWVMGDPKSSTMIETPRGLFNSMIWNTPITVSTAIPEHTALVGAFAKCGKLFLRRALTLETTNSDASDFQYNRICWRCETRLTLVISKPAGFCKVTGLV